MMHIYIEEERDIERERENLLFDAELLAPRRHGSTIVEAPSRKP